MDENPYRSPLTAHAETPRRLLSGSDWRQMTIAMALLVIDAVALIGYYLSFR